MLRYKVKQALHPLRVASRRWLMLPTMEEQGYANFHGCLYTAAAFVTRNYVIGDYLEFGVWNGDSFAKSYHALNTVRREHLAWLAANRTQQSQVGTSGSQFDAWKHTSPRFFAFDSFAGLPETAADELHEEWAKGSYACSETGFRANIAREGVNLKDVVTVPGFYEKSLTPEVKRTHSLTRAALVNIDCDLYESTVAVLNFLTDLLVQGSVIVFDDWFFYQGRPDQGEQQACAEWLTNNPHIELIEYWREPRAISFIVNIRQTK